MNMEIEFKKLIDNAFQEALINNFAELSAKKIKNINFDTMMVSIFPVIGSREEETAVEGSGFSRNELYISTHTVDIYGEDAVEHPLNEVIYKGEDDLALYSNARNKILQFKLQDFYLRGDDIIYTIEEFAEEVKKYNFTSSDVKKHFTFFSKEEIVKYNYEAKYYEADYNPNFDRNIKVRVIGNKNVNLGKVSEFLKTLF